MATRITYSFVLKPEANKRGLNPIYIRAFQHGKKIEIATSVALSKEDWSEKKQRVKRRNLAHEKYNAILEAFEKKALKVILNNFVHEDTALTLGQFKDYMHSAGQSEESFTNYILHYLNENKARLKLESWWSYKSQITKMLKFKKEVAFADINEKFINDYQHYMLHVLRNNENTVSKSLRSLRTFVNISMRYGYIKSNPFKYITIKKVDGKRDFLTAEELNKLSQAYFTGEIVDVKEKEILQYFLFSCYTGLRYSDLKVLKTSSIEGNSLQIKMHKTGYMVGIPLTNKALQLLPEQSQSQTVFRVYCNKVTNRILKELGRRYNIPKKLTCHVARHTFATVSITLGIPIEVVSKLLGHTNLKTTQVYAKIVDSVKEREMAKWDTL
ncbi:site-specific integrase [Pedobacter hartonius]|uniref:Site-specific recombinase XerD n=1 Tax=Pedobacter hartonius TaxID=425514 RepID=A0A1H4F6W0_9SPHI|nr:site-specific integrase [Pedobacter hartonius]SEA92212.1 Site-specific recombinase XerD [Pedobacter hartonius]